VKGALLTAAVSLALLVPASAPAYDNGTYRGTTAQGLPFSLKVKGKRVRVGPRGHRRTVRRRYVDTVSVQIKGTCPDGYVDTYDYGTRFDARVVAGRFAYVLGRGAERLRIRGRLSGRGRNSRATGTARDVTANRGHGGLCRSGRVRWTAARGGRSPSPAPAPAPAPQAPTGQHGQPAGTGVLDCSQLPGSGSFTDPLVIGTVTQTTIARGCRPLTSGSPYNVEYFVFELPSPAPPSSNAGSSYVLAPDADSAVHPRLATTGGFTLLTSSADGYWLNNDPGAGRRLPIGGRVGTYILGFEKLFSPLGSLSTPPYDAVIELR
jgi:hypothetical protein